MLPRPQRQIRTPLPIATLLEHPRAPPLQTPQPPPRGIQKGEKDDDDAEREARVQRRGERHGVLGPPEGRAAAEVRVEEEADEGPDGEVEARGRGDPAQAAEEDGEVDLAEDVVAVAVAAAEPDEDGGDEADGEGPDEGPVEGAGAEEALRADDAPEDAAVEVHAGEGADEAVDGFGGADVWDVGEHPVQDADLNDARDEGRGDLDLEEELGGDLHVVAQFEVGGELDALRRGDVAVCDKDLVSLNRINKTGPKVGQLTSAHHISNGPPWEDCPADELANEVETALLIRDSHDDADWYEEEGGEGKSEQ